MTLPDLNDAGDLPEGIYKATIDEVVSQFGSGTAQREIVTEQVAPYLSTCQRYKPLSTIAYFR